MKAMLEVVGITILMIIAIFVLVFGLLALYNITIDRPFCNEMADMNPDQQIKWEFWPGCLIYAEEEGMWLRYDDYMNFLNLRGEVNK
jgi:hypothetical protein